MNSAHLILAFIGRRGPLYPSKRGARTRSFAIWFVLLSLVYAQLDQLADANCMHSSNARSRSLSRPVCRNRTRYHRPSSDETTSRFGEEGQRRLSRRRLKWSILLYVIRLAGEPVEIDRLGSQRSLNNEETSRTSYKRVLTFGRVREDE